MIDLIRQRVNEVSFNGTDSIEQLQRIIGAAKFAFADIWHLRTPRSEDFYIAIDELGQVEAQEIDIFNKPAFDLLSSSVTTILDKLKASLSEKRLEETDSLFPLMDGEAIYSQKEEIQFALLLVEQQYIHYFKGRTCHLPSQPHDRLFCHYTIYTENGQSRLNFRETDDMPEYIQTSAIAAVKGIVEKYRKK